MDIKMTRNDRELTVSLAGKLDTLSSPELEERLEPELEDTEKLIFDLGEVTYMSSAGLRVLVGAARIMVDRENIILRNVPAPVMDILNVTGFSGAFVIE